MPTPTLISVHRNGKRPEQAQSTQDPNGQSQAQRTKQEHWQAIYSGPVDADVAASAAGLPVVGKAYGGLFCTRVFPTRSPDSPYAWDIVVDYANKQQQSTPTNKWNITFDRSGVPFEQTAQKDQVGLPLCNLVGDLLPELPTQTLFDEVFTIRYSTSAVPAWVDDTYEGYLNRDDISFTICGITRTFTPNQLLCTGLPLSCLKSVTGQDVHGNPTYTITYNIEMSFQVRKPDWTWHAANEGWYGFNDNNVYGLLRARDLAHDPNSTDPDSLTPLTSPTALDAEGLVLARGAAILFLPQDGVPDDPGDDTYQFGAEGRFVIPPQASMSVLFDGLNDEDQIPPPPPPP